MGVKKREFPTNTIECAFVRLMMALSLLENQVIPLIEFFLSQEAGYVKVMSFKTRTI